LGSEAFSVALKLFRSLLEDTTVYASPQCPCLLNPDSLRNTIAQGVSSDQFAYIGKKSESEYDPFLFDTAMQANDIEFSEDL